MDCCNDFKECEILNWSDFKTSAMVLASINLVFFVGWIAEMNLFSIAAYLLLFYIIAGIAISKMLMKEAPQSGDTYEHVTKEQVEKFVRWFYKTAKSLEDYMKRVTSLEDTALTAKFFVKVFAVNVISSWFCECFLIWSALNVMFLWSPIYNSNKDLIDGTIEQTKKSACEYYGIVKSMIPKYVEKK